jgi:hypothetical protein
MRDIIVQFKVCEFFISWEFCPKYVPPPLTLERFIELRRKYL